MGKFKKPYYQLSINSFCQTEVYVNDVLVDDWKGEQTKGSQRGNSLPPINHLLLQSGKYTVVGKMYPKYGEKRLTEDNSYLGIDFYVSEIDNIKATRVPFHPKIESPWDGLSENINYPYFEIKTEIEVELPFILEG